jgi:hypothetical protein
MPCGVNSALSASQLYDTPEVMPNTRAGIQDI